MTNLCDDGAINLVCAIATRAAADYTNANNVIHDNKASLMRKAEAYKTRRDCVGFFNGDWFRTMLELAPDDVISITPEEFSERLDEDFELVRSGMLPPKRAYNNTTREVAKHA